MAERKGIVEAQSQRAEVLGASSPAGVAVGRLDVVVWETLLLRFAGWTVVPARHSGAGRYFHRQRLLELWVVARILLFARVVAPIGFLAD